MADLIEAFNILKVEKKTFQNIDYFFTQRTLNEEHEYFDKNMNRKIKKLKVMNNFLALNIPTIITTTNNHGETIEIPLGFDIEIFGDEGYHYKGTITSYQGIVPNFMIPLKGDKKLFVNINYKFTDDNKQSTKKFVNFIEVPKRFQQIEELENSTDYKKIDSENKENDNISN